MLLVKEIVTVCQTTKVGRYSTQPMTPVYDDYVESRKYLTPTNNNQ